MMFLFSAGSNGKQLVQVMSHKPFTNTGTGVAIPHNFRGPFMDLWDAYTFFFPSGPGMLCLCPRLHQQLVRRFPNQYSIRNLSSAVRLNLCQEAHDILTTVVCASSQSFSPLQVPSGEVPEDPKFALPPSGFLSGHHRPACPRTPCQTST